MPIEERFTVKEIWLTEEAADLEVNRLNQLAKEQGSRYVVLYTRLHRGDDALTEDR